MGTLPGLRMFKGEDIPDVLKRIAADELGLEMDLTNKIFLGQYVGKFKTEHSRHDLSTGYMIKCSTDSVLKVNSAHFSSFKLIRFENEIPNNIGAMYAFYLKNYFKLKN